MYLLSIYDKSDYENISNKLIEQLIKNIKSDVVENEEPESSNKYLGQEENSD